MNLKQKILSFYNEVDEDNIIQSFSSFKIYMLYPITIMDDNLLNLISGIATGLSINIFTGFISFDGKGMIDLLMWVVRLTSAIIVNYCLIRIAIFCTILRIEAKKDSENQIIQRDKAIVYRKSMLNHYNEYYGSIKKYTLKGFLWLIVLVLCVVVIPVFIFILNNCGQLCGFIDCNNMSTANNVK